MVISILLLLLLGGVLGVNFMQSKAHLEEQLNTQAENTAYALSLAIAEADADPSKVKPIIDAVFKNGQYRLIELENIERLPVYRKSRVPNTADIPSWFVDIIKIHTQIIEKLISRQNETIGVLLVQANEAAAYRQLYAIFKYTLVVFVVAAFIGLILLQLVLNYILRSLENIKNQAEGIVHNRFIVQKEIPSTAELKNVTLAMNTMVKRVKELYERSSEAMKKSQESLYYDPMTGLYNRRYFQVKLPEYLLANDSRSRGTFMLIRMNRVSEANKRVGHKRIDELFGRFATILKKSCELVHEPLIARINGTEFALVLPVYNEITAKDLAQKIIGEFMILSDRNGLRETLYLSIGMCAYVRKEPVSTLLSCADSALCEAALYHENRISVFEEEKEKQKITKGKTMWRSIIETALKEKKLQPKFHPVFDIKQHKDVSYTLSFDILHGTQAISYGEYVPAVIELGMEHELMEYELEYMKTHRFTQNAISFELIADMLQESDKFLYFEDVVTQIAQNLNGHLFIEISEYDLLALKPIVVEHISIALKAKGIRFGIDRFNADRSDFSHLKYTAPAYVKMHVSHYLDMDTASQNALLTLLGSLDIQLIVVGVRQKDLEKLKAAAIRYVIFD